MIGRVLKHWRRHERFRFLVIGGWNTLFGYLCFLVLYALLHVHLHYLLIGTIAHFIAATNAFACHRLLVFRSHGALLAEFVRFNLAQVFVLCCGLFGLWVLVSDLQVAPLVAQACVTVVAVVISYLAHRRFTFAA